MSPTHRPTRSPAPSRSGTPASARRVRRGPTDRWARRRRGDDGVTLVEVLIASVILLVTMLPMGILLTSATTASSDTRQRQSALQLADSWIEILSNSQPPPGTDGQVLTNRDLTPVAPRPPGNGPATDAPGGGRRATPARGRAAGRSLGAGHGPRWAEYGWGNRRS